MRLVSVLQGSRDPKLIVCVSIHQGILVNSIRNLIDGIGRFVLQSACLQFIKWQSRYADRAPKLMAVNLSRAHCLVPILLQKLPKC